MSLPPKFFTAHEYFVEVFSFLKEFEWLYNYHNTDILVNSVFDKFPEDWKIYFEEFTNDDLNNLTLGVLRNRPPESLQVFFNRLICLKPENSRAPSRSCDLKVDNIKGVGLKKRHEILNLAPLIRRICDKMKVDLLVDVGSGRGYLSHVLYNLYKYEVLGIEASPDKINSALHFQNDNYKNSTGHVKYVEHYITKTSGRHIEQFLADNFPDEFNEMHGFCITGLHACADLSCTILDIFLENEKAKSLVIMPCCYHRLALQNEQSGRQYFENFPLSNCLKTIHREYDAASFLRTPFLRLACQDTADVFNHMTREEHDAHARMCFFRSILQAVANESKYLLAYNLPKY